MPIEMTSTAMMPAPTLFRPSLFCADQGRRSERKIARPGVIGGWSESAATVRVAGLTAESDCASAGVAITDSASRRLRGWKYERFTGETYCESRAVFMAEKAGPSLHS